MRPRSLACAAALALAATAVPARDADAQAARRQPIELLPQVVSINPLLLPFGGLIAEYEAVASPTVTIGGGLAYYDFVGGDGDRYTSGEAKVRFYPQERAPEGVSLGLTLGFGRSYEDGLPEGEDRTRFGLTTGVEVDYNWRVGPTKRFFVGTGVGVKRRYGDLRNDWIDLEVLPTARFQVGVVF